VAPPGADRRVDVPAGGTGAAVDPAAGGTGATAMSEDQVARFRTFGFTVLRQAVDPGPLSAEVDLALRDGFRSPFRSDAAGGIEGRYLPMMCELTPVSLSLLDRFAGPAAALLGAPVIPVRAKGILYDEGASWHNDSGHEVASIGFACYLEALDADTGALRVMPGSHLPGFGRAMRHHIARPRSRPAAAGTDAWVRSLPGYAIPTEPGDVIAFDEHLYHASAGGRNRRQWRVDYVADPAGAEQEDRVRAYLASVYLPDWDGGYDVDRYPSYGPCWLESGRPWVSRLGDLGAYSAAAAEEAFARSRRPSG
jgi:hypothetical protein